MISMISASCRIEDLYCRAMDNVDVDAESPTVKLEPDHCPPADSDTTDDVDDDDDDDDETSLHVVSLFVQVKPLHFFVCLLSVYGNAAVMMTGLSVMSVVSF